MTWLVAALLLTGCGADRADRADGAGEADRTAVTSQPLASQPPASQPLATQPPSAPPCTSPLDGLTQRQRIAQLFTVGVSSMADARNAVQQYGIGGIFLGSNVVAEAVTTDGLARRGISPADVPPPASPDPGFRSVMPRPRPARRDGGHHRMRERAGIRDVGFHLAKGLTAGGDFASNPLGGLPRASPAPVKATGAARHRA